MPCLNRCMPLLLVFTAPLSPVAVEPITATLKLPAYVTPVEYQTDLTIDPRLPTFSGLQRITVEVRQPDSVVLLHASALHIKRAVIRQGSSEWTARASQIQPGLLSLNIETKLNPGRAEIEVAFEGVISQIGHQGLYHSRSGGSDYILSQFESISARSAFPCIDEPDYKVPWQLTLRVPAIYQAYSNTNPEIESRENSGDKVIRFHKTRPLPAYLIALAVGNFSELPAGKTQSGAPMRVIVPKGDEEKASAAVADVQSIMRLLEGYFGVPYPYEKLDHLLTPDNRGHAEENAGLIIYDGSGVLVQPGQDTRAKQLQRGYVLAHEMAHQWTGDLVTMRWWDDLWLNESMATWMDNKIIELWKPELASEDVALTTKQTAIDSDRLLSARKVHREVISEGDLTNAFDPITYGKGASVLRMVEAQAGEQSFQKGIQLYLRRFAHANANESEFLAALRDGSGQDLSAIFRAFLDQPGVPVVNVRVECRPGPVLHLEQKRFLQIGSVAEGGQLWKIPICIKFHAQATGRACFVLSQRSALYRLERAAACPTFVEVNADELGYYLPQYSPDLWRSLSASVEQLTTREQKGLLFSQRALFEEGQVPAPEALGLIELFARSKEPSLQAAALDTAAILTSNYVDPDLEPKVAIFVDRTFGPQARKLGWLPVAGENLDRVNIRQKLVPFVASIGRDKELRTEANELARQWLDRHTQLDSRSRRPVLAAAAIEGDEHRFEAYLAAFRASRDREEQDDLLYALGSFENPNLHEKALSLMLDEVGILEAYPLVQPSFADPSLRRRFFPFMEHHYNQMLTRMPRDAGRDFAVNMITTGNILCSSEQLQSFSSFFLERAKQISGGNQALARTTESIRGCIARKAALTPSLREFLSDH